ncbi:MAG TPA: YitT family protein [Bacilli bacterium]|nr:YitT family protein [Bacilli bacterium]HQA19572.1 YitT family protein [Bacilli bacterium]
MKYFLTKERIKEWLYINLGILLMALAYSFFLEPKNIVIGGVSGLAIIFKHLWNLDPAFVILVLNVALLLIGLFILGKDFFIKTIYGSLIFPLFVKLLSLLAQAINFKLDDFFLIVAFSSILSGVGLGLVIKHGGTTGGTEIPQKILFKLFHMPFSVSLYILDGLVIAAAYIVYRNIEVILYALIYLAIVGLVMDAIIFSGFNKRAVYIISKKHDQIKERLLHDFDRGVTGIKVTGEYTNQEQKMLLCVLSSAEYYKLRTIIEEIDPNAFYFAVRASEVRGEGFTYERQ